MEDTTAQGVLTDEHLVWLSQRLTNYGNLRSLAYRDLGLQPEEIEPSITNNPNDVQSAVHDILQTWVKQQETREKAFSDIYTALKESQLQMLAEELLEWEENRRRETNRGPILNEMGIKKLSQNIKSIGDLRTLAYRGLKLDSSHIEPAIIGKKEDCQAAGNEILLDWLKEQINCQEAFNSLKTALQECGMQTLADELHQSVNSTEIEIEAGKTEMLTDVHLVQLSSSIINVGELRTLAYKGLLMDHTEIEQSITNKPHDMMSAAHDILLTWCQQQKNRQEAYIKLQDALHKCKLVMPTEELNAGFISKSSK